MTAALLNSAAVPLLAQAQALGLTFRVDGGSVVVAPQARIPAPLLEALRAHRDAIRAVLTHLDAGVEARRDVFAAQLAQHARSGLPAFLFRPGHAYVPGACFSCGELTDRPGYGRCWRCAFAWRLACAALGQVVDPVLAATHDEAKCA